MSLIAAERTVGYALQKQPMTAAEFLAWDASQTVKHEFVRGEVFAMAGAGERHIIAVGNLLMTVPPDALWPTWSRPPAHAVPAA